ncbi:hypothetical protein SAMN02990966_06005 [Rhodospirillales bacterium URHD0017]|nr:hypothetical protein SAMN02990966_06005 [Rhodospirillales bacterium URHD0017]
MTLVSNVYVTHGVMLLCAVGAAYSALPDSTGRVVAEWRPAVTALLAAVSALALIAYPTWGELKNPGLWMFAILAAVAGAARGYWLRIYVDHSWRLIRLRKAHDGLIATAGLVGLALVEITLAAVGPAEQPTMELGLTVVASFVVGRSAAVLVRSRQEPQSDLHDRRSPPGEG